MRENENIKAKHLLGATAAGRRYIAYLTILNSGSGERLRQFIAESFTEAALARHDSAERLDWHAAQAEETGRLRVEQVLASEEYALIVMLQAEQGGVFYYSDLRVEDDYPHRIRVFNLFPVFGTDINVQPFQEW